MNDQSSNEFHRGDTDTPKPTISQPDTQSQTDTLSEPKQSTENAEPQKTPASQSENVGNNIREGDYIVSPQGLADTLKKRNLTMTGDRTLLSNGFNGPLFTITTEEGIDVVEVTFTRGGTSKNIERGKNYMLVDKKTDHPSLSEVRSRLGIVNPETSEIDKVAIDWIYNEEQALKALEGIPGIPKFYGAVREGTRGSVLMELIDGYDLFDIVKNESPHDISEIFDKIIETYCQAAEQGYLYNNPTGSTIMVDRKTKQPYLLDWYNHATGSIKSDKNFQNKFLQGLSDLTQMRGTMLTEYYQDEFKEI